MFFGNSKKREALIHKERARQFISEERFSEALDEVNLALPLNQEDEELHLAKSLCLEYINRIDEALDEMDVAIKYASEKGFYYFMKGRSLNIASRYEEAIKEYSLALQLTSDSEYTRYYIDAMYEVAQCLYWIGNYDEAIIMCDTLLSQDANHIAGYNLKADCLEAALRLDPNNDTYYAALSLLFISRKRFHDAIKLYNIRIAYAPEEDTIFDRVCKAKCLFELGELEKEKNELLHIINLCSKYDREYMWKGYAHIKLGQTTEAINSIEISQTRNGEGIGGELQEMLIQEMLDMAIELKSKTI